MLSKGKAAVTAIKLMRHLPMPLLQQCGATLGRLNWYGRSRARSVALANVSACFPDYTPKAQRQLARAAVVESGKTLVEMASLWCNPISYGRKLIKKVHNQALLDQALQADRGLVLILPHLGNWELTNHYITTQTQVVALYQPAKLPELEQLIQQGRNRSGTQMMPTNARGVKSIYRQLKSGGTSVVLADQEPPESGGVFADFFQVPALTQTLVPRLLQQTGAQALMIFTLRNPNEPGAFEVFIEPVDPGLFNPTLAVAAAALNHSVEACAKRALQQYQWTYKRFKHQPDPNQSIY